MNQAQREMRFRLDERARLVLGDALDGFTYNVSETFASIQGEGCFTGTRALFIRLAGCNATPDFICYDACDTKWSRTIPMEGSLGTCGYTWGPMTIRRLLDRVYDEQPLAHVVITGGEPTLQPLIPLCTALDNLGRVRVQIETNGTNVAALADLRRPTGLEWGGVPFITISPKTRQPDDSRLSLRGMIEYADELKLLVRNAADVDYYLSNVADVPTFVGRSVRVCVQPVDNSEEAIALCFGMMSQRPNWRLSVQVHKLLGWK